MKFTINIEKRFAYAIVGILVIALGVLVVWAYNSGQNPAFVGHTAEELDLSGGVNGNAVFNGNVGIGTNNPQTKFVVKNSVNNLQVQEQCNIPLPGKICSNLIIQGDLINGDGLWDETGVRFAGWSGGPHGSNFRGSNYHVIAPQGGSSIIDIRAGVLDGSGGLSSQAYINIHSDGNIGIGTTNPQYKLDVNGAVKGSQLCIGSDCRSSWPSGGSGGGSGIYSCKNTCSLYYTVYHYSHVYFPCFKINSTHCVTGEAQDYKSETHRINRYADCGQIRVYRYEDNVMGGEYAKYYICSQLGWVPIP